MSKVFVSGSRAISRLPADVVSRLENIIIQGHDVVTGDANGVDKAIQHFFSDRSYQDIVIYYVGEEPRNNIGSWRSIAVEVAGNYRGRELYTQKDKRMAEVADSGMIVWDGKKFGLRSKYDMDDRQSQGQFGLSFSVEELFETQESKGPV